MLVKLRANWTYPPNLKLFKNTTFFFGITQIILVNFPETVSKININLATDF